MKRAICHIIVSMMAFTPLTTSTVTVPEPPICVEVQAEDTSVEQIEPEVTDVTETTVIVCKLTAYCSENYPHICNNGDSSTTSTGVIPIVGRTCAVDPSVIPYGSEVTINGHTYIAEDCGGAVKGNRVDILFATHQEALAFGVQYAEVEYKKP